MSTNSLDTSGEKINKIVSDAIKEDLGNGDVTGKNIVDENQLSEFVIKTNIPCVVCGISLIDQILGYFRPVKLTKYFKDGDQAKAGDILVTGTGHSLDILSLERVVLNILQHLCGIATETRKYVNAIRNTNSKIIDTRKTLPNLRLLQKYAVKVGGGVNGRMSLEDNVVIKKNHIIIAGSITEAVNRVSKLKHSKRIEVECHNLEEVKEALNCNVNIIMLENFSLENVKKTIELSQNKVKVAVSGNITIENVRNFADLGVDMIAIGKITHSVKSSDVSLEIIPDSN